MWFFVAIEWFFNLFLSKKAKEVKQQAFLERQNAVLDYGKVKSKTDKKQSKYSGLKRYQKA